MKVAPPHVTLEQQGRWFAFCSGACTDRFRASLASYADLS
jgi:hypothetical protein